MKKTDPKRELNETFRKRARDVRHLFLKRGGGALEAAEKSVLNEDIECKEVREALAFFMAGWRDFTRPALVSLSCEAVGGEPNLTVSVGKSLILISGGIDIHDDIIDETEVKGPRQTVMGRFGRDVALLTGNALLIKGLISLYATISELRPADAAYLIGIFKGLLSEMSDGEAIELRFRGRVDVNPKEYIAVVRRKAADVEAYTRLGAFLGGGSKAEVEALGKYGRILGMVAILRDDLADMLDLGEIQRRTAKESLPLPLLYALRNPEVGSKIKATLRKGITDKSDIEALFDLTVKGRGLIHLNKLFKKLAKDATRSIMGLKKNREVFEQIIDVTLPPSIRSTPRILRAC